MVNLPGNSVLAITTCTAVLMQTIPVQGDDAVECSGDDLFWDEDRCLTCTRCGIGMQSTAGECGSGTGTQGICEYCPAEYYQSSKHTKESCKRCIQCDPGGGIELRSCTKEHNRVCGCNIGFGINPWLENTCIKCDLWTGIDPLEGCADTTPPPITTEAITTEYTTHTRYNGVESVGPDKSLSDAAVIAVSITACVMFLFGLAVCVAFIVMKDKTRQPPVRLNNNSVESHPMSAVRSIARPEEVKPLMNGINSTNQLDSSVNSSGLTVQLAPRTLLRTLEQWRLTPQGTPAGTPKISPRSSTLFSRSISEPCGGNTSSGSAERFTPNNSIVQEESDSPSPLSIPVIPDNARRGALKCEEDEKRKLLMLKKQRARSIGAKRSLQELTEDYNVMNNLSRKVKIQEGGIKKDWRNLAAEWGYSQSDIDEMKDASRTVDTMGFAILLEKECTERCGLKTVEHLLDGLEKIKREDAVGFLSDYLIAKAIESTV